MPELPEVETIKRGLEKKIVGLTIKRIEVLNFKSFQGRESEIEGNKVIGVWRRAKIMGLDLSDDISLLIHLKMTGQLIWISKSKIKSQKSKSQVKSKNLEILVGGHPTENMMGGMPNKSTRVIFEFNNSSHLYFNDQRKFGWIKIVNRKSLIINQDLLKLGPEPLDKEFTWQVLKRQLLKHPKLPIKVVLMDQTAVAGIGNIYASESLFSAGIDPCRKVNSLSESDFKKLAESIKKSLEMAIKHGGSTRTHFVNADGKKGRFLDYANVYNRAGLPCQRCSGTVIKITLGGRGTFFCPECQK